MKTPLLKSTLLLLGMALAVLTSCASDPYVARTSSAGKLVSERNFELGGKRFVEQKYRLSSGEQETRVTQVP